MKKKGFTIIELLAVIVVLALIALIITPILMNVIEDAKKSAAERTVSHYIDTVNTVISAEEIEDNYLDGEYIILENGNLCPSDKTCTEENDYEIKIDMDGTKPRSGTILIEDGKVIINHLVMAVDDFTVVYDEIGAQYIIDKPISFENDSWEVIRKHVKVGNLSKYNVGDTRKITLTGKVAGTYTVRIANTSTPEECSTEGFSQTACGFVVEFEDIITNRGMNSTDSNAGGWKASEMNTYVNNTILKSLPTDLQNVITSTYVSSGSATTTTDKLYLLSPGEVWDVDYESSKTRQLDYYKNKGVTTDSYSGAKKQYNGNDTKWWLRLGNKNRFFYYASSNGNLGYTWPDSEYGVSPVFRIG